MKNDEHLPSRLLICSGALLAVSGVLMALCVALPYGGLLWAAASCMFFAARHFRLAENKNTHKEDSDHEKTSL